MSEQYSNIITKEENKDTWISKIPEIYELRYSDHNLRTLMFVFNYLCKVTPRWVKK